MKFLVNQTNKHQPRINEQNQTKTKIIKRKSGQAKTKHKKYKSNNKKKTFCLCTLYDVVDNYDDEADDGD